MKFIEFSRLFNEPSKSISFIFLFQLNSSLPCRTLLPNDDTNSEQHWRSVCPSWEKFLALTDLLEYNLNDIADGLSRKKFVSFTGQEMIHLIKALFEDSPRRESLINSIAEISS